MANRGDVVSLEPTTSKKATFVLGAGKKIDWEGVQDEVN